MAIYEASLGGGAAYQFYMPIAESFTYADQVEGLSKKEILKRTVAETQEEVPDSYKLPPIMGTARRDVYDYSQYLFHVLMSEVSDQVNNIRDEKKPMPSEKMINKIKKFQGIGNIQSSTDIFKNLEFLKSDNLFSTQKVKPQVETYGKTIELRVEDPRTGKVIKLEVQGHHTIEKIVEIIVENTNMPTIEGYTRSLVYKGIEFSGATKVQQIVDAFGLSSGDKMALWGKIVGGSYKFQELNTKFEEFLRKKGYTKSEITIILEQIGMEEFLSITDKESKKGKLLDNFLRTMFNIDQFSKHKINKFLSSKNQFTLKTLKSFKKEMTQITTDFIFENEILPIEMRDKFELISALILKISSTKNQFIGIKDLSIMIGNDDQYISNSLETNPDITLEFLSALYDVLTIKEMVQMKAPKIFSEIQRNHFKYINYYRKYEKIFSQHIFTAKNRDTYPKLFSNPGVIKQQRNILYQLQGGRDLLTGKKIDKTELKYTERHHWLTTSQENKVDCRIRSLVLLLDTNHKKITGEMRNDLIKRKEYEDMFRKAIDKLLQGKPPEHWDKKDQEEFLEENPNGVNYKGIKFLYYY